MMAKSGLLKNCPCCGAIWQPVIQSCLYCTYTPTAPEKLSKEDGSTLLWFGRVLEWRLTARVFSKTLKIYKNLAYIYPVGIACIYFICFLFEINIHDVASVLFLVSLPVQTAWLSSMKKWVRMRYVDDAYKEVADKMTNDFLRGRNQSKRNLEYIIKKEGAGTLHFLPGFLPVSTIKTRDVNERTRQVVDLLTLQLGRNCFVFTESRKFMVLILLTAFIVTAGYLCTRIYFSTSYMTAIGVMLPVSLWSCWEVSGQWYLMNKLVPLRPSKKYFKKSFCAPLESYAKATGRSLDELLGSTTKFALYEQWYRSLVKLDH